MCGRYTLATPADLISEHFELAEVPGVESRFNIAPSQEALIIGSRRDGRRAAGMAVWGLTTPFTTHSGKKPLINARIETADQRPSFREAFSRRRCLVPADGFYEWRAEPQGKVPHYFSLRDSSPFAFAGIWNQPEADSDLATFAILTTEPNQIIRSVHARMPVILPPEHYDLWLTKKELSRSDADRIATPFPDIRMEVRKVSTLVNNPANDTAACISSPDGG